MTTEAKTEANRRNALQSTGPKAGEGIEAARINALAPWTSNPANGRSRRGRGGMGSPPQRGRG